MVGPVHATLFSMPNYCLHLKVTVYVCVVINTPIFLSQVNLDTCSLMQVGLEPTFISDTQKFNTYLIPISCFYSS